VILLIKKIDNDGRLAEVPDMLTTQWTIEIADSEDKTDFSSALTRADALVSMDWPATMPPAPQLKLLQLPGAGTDEIALDSVPAQATVCNVFEHETGISEYVLATMLQWVIPIPKLDAALRGGKWHGSQMYGPRHQELFGQTLGIIGYGRIGREVARRARAFGMRMRACSRTPGDGDDTVEAVEPMDNLKDILSQSDFVLLTMPLSSQTCGMIGASELATMKPSAVIINVARGPLIDEEALFDACRDRIIGGAIIDTWYCYPSTDMEVCPPSRFAFHELDNVIMTPHASAWTEQLMPRRNQVIARNLDRLARNEPLLNIVRAPVQQANQ
jgi:phosphoglycerate dehydrogenase-like enzyme